MKDQSPKKTVTLNTLRRMQQRGEKIAMLTCYDALTAQWLARGGVKMVLVGDSMANVIAGEPRSIYAPLDILIYLTAAVKRSVPNLFVMGDMPFMSYQVSTEQAIENAGRMMIEGRADAVKFEFEASDVELVKRLTRAGVPVVAHFGWKPQRGHLTGIRTAKVAGRTADEVQDMVRQAKAFEAAGAVMLLVEQVTAEASEKIVEAVEIPVIGCGGGPACDGQVVVLHDLMGMTDHQPSFAPALTNFGEQLSHLAEDWVLRVNQGKDMNTQAHHMSIEEAEKLNHLTGRVNSGH